MNPNALIIFIKNPELGKVKTRIAKEVGDEKALKLYTYLLQYTRKVSKEVNSDKLLFYSEFIDWTDEWENTIFQKFIQEDTQDLGKRMQKAYEFAFAKRYQKIVIIGSDCLDITSSILNQAFEALEDNEFVIGPTEDGGYYLLGMKHLHIPLFENKKWSTETVFFDTVENLKTIHASYVLLPKLKDIDTKADLIEYEMFEFL